MNVINQKINDLMEIVDKNDNDEPEAEIEVENIFPITDVRKLDTLENFLGSKQNFKLLVRTVKLKIQAKKTQIFFPGSKIKPHRRNNC